jgi:hypothetical protein
LTQTETIRQESAATRARRSARLRERRIALVSLFCALILFSATSAFFNRYRSFWSPDSGPRLAMIRNLMAHGDLIHLRYANADVDPFGVFHPLGLMDSRHLLDGSVVRLPDGRLTPQYPPLFPLLSTPPYRLFGWRGLTLIPLVCGACVVAMIYLLACRLELRSRALFPPLLALATPLILYSSVFWDHTAQILIASIGALLLLRSLQEGRMRFAAAAGAVLGFGLFFHELFAVLFAGLVLGAVVVSRLPEARRALAGLVAGFMPMLALWMAVNLRLYGVAGGPHLIAQRNLNRSADFWAMMAPGEVLRRLSLHTLGLDPPVAWIAAICLILAVAYFAGMAVRGKGYYAAPIACLLFAPVAAALLHGATWAEGLFEAAPLLAPAIAWPMGADRSDDAAPCAEIAFLRWSWVACVVFGVVVVLNPQQPGLWGDRYLLLLLPFAACLSAHALETMSAGIPLSWRAAVPVAAVCLAAASLYSAWLGLVAVRDRVAGFRDYNNKIIADRSQVLVFDKWYFGAHIVDRPASRLFLVRDTASEGAQFAAILDKLSVTEFTWVGTNDRSTLLALASAVGGLPNPFYPAGDVPAPGAGLRFVRRYAGASWTRLTPQPPSPQGKGELPAGLVALAQQ